MPREELIDALWPEASASDRLSPLLSKLRRSVPVDGRGELRLELPPDAWVDVEAAAEALHRAEGAIAAADWRGAWGPGRVAQHITARTLLPGEDAPWIEAVRRRLDELHVRALELVGGACLRIGGGELATARRAALELVDRAPYRESGHRLLMETLSAHGDRAEALVVYEELRRRLRDGLGTTPSAETQALHRALLR